MDGAPTNVYNVWTTTWTFNMSASSNGVYRQQTPADPKASIVCTHLFIGRLTESGEYFEECSTCGKKK
jgi:hypothetical protein